MACSNCGGGGRRAASTSKSTASSRKTKTSTAAADSEPGEWRVTYPNGVIVPFPMEWQARQAVALSGGSMEFVPGRDTAT